MSMNLLDDLESLSMPDFTYATLEARIGAFILDGIVIAIPNLLLTILSLAVFKSMFILLFIALLSPIYKIGMEGKFGYTLGKKQMGFRVVKVNSNDPMDLVTAMKRYIFSFPALFFSLIVTIYTFDDNALGMTDGLNNWLQYRNPTQLSGSDLLNVLYLGSTAVFYIAVLFIFKGVSRQTLYDRFAQTVCVEMEKRKR